MTSCPIIIPFKEVSVRCPNKNFVLFPYVMEWLKAANSHQNEIVVVSNSDVVKKFVSSYSVRFVDEKLKNVQTDTAAIFDALSTTDADYCIHLPLTSVLRNKSLLDMTIAALQTNDCDFVTSFMKMTDRSLYYIDDNNRFLHQSEQRKGCMCQCVKMLDGAIYGIRRHFLEQVVAAEDVNKAFWSGKFATVENQVDVFLDVDSPNDMARFQNLSSESWFA